MARPTVEKLYEDIQSLSPREQHRLMALVSSAHARGALDAASQPKRSLLELHGLGKEIWAGVDAQQYVDQLRSEWGDPRDPTRGRALGGSASG